MGEHDTGERGFGRRDTGPTSFGPEAIGSDPIDPNHEAFPAGEPAVGPTSAQAQARPPGQPRLPRPEPETAAGSGGGRGGADDRHGQAFLEGPSRGPRRSMPIPAAPAVEHDGWRAGDTIDIDETPRRRFSFQLPPYMKVAAVIAVATSFGALAGTFAATSFAPEPAAPAVVRVPDDGALRATVADLQRDVAGLRTSLENSTKALQTQTAKLTDRMERTERAQAEPAQKLARLGDAIDRLEKRVGQTASQTQGSGAPPSTLQAQAAAAQGGQASTVQASSAQAAAPLAVASADVTASLGDPRPPAPPVVNGWVVRDVRRGIALLEGRYGYVEVEPGDRLPDGLRVESIRKQDGRWIVVTSRGLIVAR